MDVAGFQALSEDTESDMDKSMDTTAAFEQAEQDDKPADASGTDEQPGDKDKPEQDKEDDVLTLPVPVEGQGEGQEDIGEDEEEKLLNPDDDAGNQGDGKDVEDQEMSSDKGTKVADSEDKNEDDVSGLEAVEKDVDKSTETLDETANNSFVMDESTDKNVTTDSKDNDESKEGDESKLSDDSPVKSGEEKMEVDENQSPDKQNKAGSDTDSADDSPNKAKDRLLEDPIDKEVDLSALMSEATAKDSDDFVILEDEEASGPKRIKKMKYKTRCRSCNPRTVRHQRSVTDTTSQCGKQTGCKLATGRQNGRSVHRHSSKLFCEHTKRFENFSTCGDAACSKQCKCAHEY